MMPNYCQNELTEEINPDPECFEEVAKQPALHTGTGRGFVAVASCSRLLRTEVGDDVSMKVFKTVDDVAKGLFQYCDWCCCENLDIILSQMGPIPGCWKYDDWPGTEQLYQKFGEGAFRRFNGDLAGASKCKSLGREVGRILEEAQQRAHDRLPMALKSFDRLLQEST